MERSAHAPSAASISPASLVVTLPLAILQRDGGQLFRLRSLRLYSDPRGRARAYATVEPHTGDPLEPAQASIELCGEGSDLLAACCALGVQLFGSALPFLEHDDAPAPEYSDVELAARRFGR